MAVRTMILLVPFLFLLTCGKKLSLMTSSLERSPVKTIQTKYGDIYDCVDFYEQPALKHPSLKGHNFHPQVRPTSRPNRKENSGISSPVHQIDTRLKDGGCPSGTVPIMRIEKDRINRFKKLNQNSTARGDPNSIMQQPGKIFAIAQAHGPGRTYNGAGAFLSVYAPEVPPDQFSSAEIILQSGNDLIEMGWTVNPGVYKDNNVRTFIFSAAGNTLCFNSECGFVIVSTEIPLGGVLAPVSTVGGNIYEYEYFVYQDEKNGNWWLELGQNNTIVGFWPQQFFSGLAHSASYVACGGEAYMPPGQTKDGPDMGSSYMPSWGQTEDVAYCRRFLFVDDEHRIVDASGTEEFANNDNYAVVDDPTDYRPSHYVFFGGSDD